MTGHEPAGFRRPVRGGTVIGRCSCGYDTRRYHDSQKTARRELDHHIETATAPPPPACPHPGKTKFRTQAAAERALGRTWQKGRPGSRLPTRTYQCRCGYWHLTKEAKR